MLVSGVFSDIVDDSVIQSVSRAIVSARWLGPRGPLSGFRPSFRPGPVAIHSVVGCFFYGAFTAKVLLVHSGRLPGWVLPAAGGTLAVIAGVLWYTSALWYYNGYQLPHP
jgi:hypothetical protein